jgi:ribose/xylose/arabinose/galactoside ABC-type transport system permease subunit
MGAIMLDKLGLQDVKAIFSSREMTLSERLGRLGEFLADNLAWVIGVTIFLFGTLTLRAYLYPMNLRNILMHSTIAATLLIGVAICLITGFFDMAQEAILVLTACVAAWLSSSGETASGWQLPAGIAILASIGLGVGLGAFQGFCVTKLQMVPFVTSLSMRIAILGVVLVLMREGTIAPMPESYRWLGIGTIGPLPVSVAAVIVMYLATHWMLTRTRVGRTFFAVGGNRQSARNAGINDDRTIIFSFMISGFMAAIAGWMTAGRLNAANYGISVNVTFEVIAAAVIGGISMGGGRGNLLKAISGVLMITLLVNLLYLRHVNPWYVDLARGGAILAATLLDSRKKRV